MIDPNKEEMRIPPRGPDYGAEVWARLLPHLPPGRAKSERPRWGLWTPALATALALVFVAGMVTQKNRTMSAPAKSSERVLYLSLSDHLEQAQTLLTGLAHADSSSNGAPQERARARDLIMQNRILRRRARQAGDVTDAVVLDDLERVLLEVANSDMSLEAVQQRMENGNLLFRVRISGVDARMKGEKL